MTVTELQHNNTNEPTIQLNGPIQQIWENWSSNSTLIDKAGSPQQKWKAYLLMHRTQPEAWWSSNNPHTGNSALQEKKNQTSHPLEQVIPTQVIQHHRKKRTKHLTSGASDTHTGDSAPKKEKNQTSHLWSKWYPHRWFSITGKKEPNISPLEQVIPTQVIQHQRKKRTKHLTSGASDTHTGDSAPRKEKNQTSHLWSKWYPHRWFNITGKKEPNISPSGASDTHTGDSTSQE